MAIVSPKRQVTIPVVEADKAGFRPGDRIVVRTVRPGLIELERFDDVLDRFAGLLDDGAPSDAVTWVRRLREEWDA
jgi:bifunctional DNA-binding transcriptional regulator/antitoxin component of YhaV-PrlF toxin-antitoxin module